MMLKFNQLFRLDNIPTDKVNSTISDFLLRDEKIIAAYKTIRDQVVFTTKRVIFTDITGLLSPNQSVVTMPYSKVLYYAVYSDTNIFSLMESSHLYLLFSNNIDMDFMFKGSEKIYEIAEVIDKMILDPNEKEEKEEFVIPTFVKRKRYYLKSNVRQPLNPTVLELRNDDDGFLYQIFFDKLENLKGVKYDLVLTNIFDDSEIIENIYVCDFEDDGISRIKTKLQSLRWSSINAVEIKSICIIVKKYILDKTVFEINDLSIQDVSTGHNIRERVKDILSTCNEMSNATEIYRYISSEDVKDIITVDVIKSIEDILPMEKIYGNQKKDALKKISNYYESLE